MTLQSLFHFLKLFQVCFNKAEVYELIQRFEDKIRMPVDDTLNIKNGLNFAQFLECILQSAYFKLNEAGRTQEEDAYGDTLQKLFQTATNEIKHRAADDFLSAELYSAESQKVFYDNYGLLAAIFQNNTTGDPHISLRMTIPELIYILKEAGIVLEEPEEELEEEEGEDAPPVLKFYEEHARDALSGLDLLETGDDDGECLTYVDFLESLLRIGHAYPFEVAGADLPNIEAKLTWVVDKLEQAYGPLIEGFMAHLEERDQAMNFQCKMVVVDEKREDDDELSSEGISEEDDD